jgi:hypothetical protein
MEFRPVSYDEYDRTSLPLVSRMTERVSDTLDKVRPGWGGGRFGNWVDQVKKKVDNLKRVTKDASRDIDLFRPFILDNEYVLRADNIRALRDRLPPEERSARAVVARDHRLVRLLHEHPLSWFAEVGAARARRDLRAQAQERVRLPRPARALRHHDQAARQRTAMRMERGGRTESYSYRDLRELAERAGTFLVGEGSSPAIA